MHLALYEAFEWRPPHFAHVGLLQNPQGQKLSKRSGLQEHGIRSFAEMGIIPEALSNFVALLGWSHKSTDDMLPMSKLIENVSFSGLDSLLIHAEL